MVKHDKSLNKSNRIRIHFDVSAPVALNDICAALEGFGDEYASHIKQKKIELNETNNIDEIKLYIANIESNCILADLAPAIPILAQVTPFMSDINNSVDFIKNMASTINWLRSLSKKM